MFYRKIIFIFTLIAITTIAISTNSRAENTVSDTNKNSNSTPFEENVLSSGDQLHIFVFGVEPLTKDVFIDSNGNITLPLVGEVKAAGLHKEELETVLMAELADGGFYKDPKVTVELLAQQPFFILGEVREPGRYEFQPDLDVFKAVAIAGGFTARAAKGKIIIMRKVGDERIRIKATEDTPIFPGDSISVEQRFF